MAYSAITTKKRRKSHKRTKFNLKMGRVTKPNNLLLGFEVQLRIYSKEKITISRHNSEQYNPKQGGGSGSVFKDHFVQPGTHTTLKTGQNSLQS